MRPVRRSGPRRRPRPVRRGTRYGYSFLSPGISVERDNAEVFRRTVYGRRDVVRSAGRSLVTAPRRRHGPGTGLVTVPGRCHGPGTDPATAPGRYHGPGTDLATGPHRRPAAGHRNGLSTQYITAATSAAAGIVITQASPILPATPQRTAENRLVQPAPMLDGVIVWVVEIGAWKANAVVYSAEEATDSATKPRAGSSSMILRPRVRMMRQPPE